ncbi:MAG: hypothetical protein ACU837_07960 [Gammaproteobacteria bacterium]
MQSLAIDEPQGLSLDPATGRLFVLDAAGARIVVLQPKPGHDFANAATAAILLPAGLGQLRGLAFNPSDGLLYVLNPRKQKVFALSPAGELVADLVLSGQSVGIPQGMVFLPSIDNTDNPKIYHLFLLTSTDSVNDVSEWALQRGS